ncbi:hypothetical protein ERJ75_000054500 [Trypanosoma vivax]|nr:hypothetical protein ERJ75_000054500 [Trypanosoma vivax]
MQSIFKPVAFRRGMLHELDEGSAGNTSAINEENTNSFPVNLAGTAEGSGELFASFSKEWRVYPSVAFYVPAQGLQLVMNVAGPNEDVPEEANSSALLERLPQLQESVHDTSAKHGNVYYLSSVPACRNPVLYPSLQHAPVPQTTAELDYGRYLQALHDAFARFAALRDECARASSLGTHVLSHHIFLVRIANHARLKDIVLLLAVEKCRLCLCVSASSKVTQQYLTQCARDLGVELEWVLGSVLLSEPTELASTDINPVFVLWDIFVNMQLQVTTTELPDMIGGHIDHGGSRGDGERFLKHVDITVVSSLCFTGCEWHTPVMRLGEVGYLSASGRQLVWSLAPLMRVVLPHFVAALVRLLVSESTVDNFTLRFYYNSPSISTATAAATSSGTASGAGRGVAYVTGARRGGVQRRGLGSCLSFRSFSRLSAEFWLSSADRRHFGLCADDNETPLECEFVVDVLRYCRRAGLCDNEESTPVSRQTGGNENLIVPESWGRCFQAIINVERIIDDEEED